MNLLSSTLLAFSMSADAFAASVGKGMALRKPKLSQALHIGFIFGAVETVTPVIGWLLGSVASQWIASVDHWVAFGVLGVVGLKMIWEACHGDEKEAKESHKLSTLIFTAIGTSIDAMAVGATLALMDVDIWTLAAMIGAATFLMTTIGVMTGHYIGQKAGKLAELLGGLYLIAIGTAILLQHLNAVG